MITEKFWNKVLISPFHDCWEWLGNRRPDGYGRFQFDKQLYLAHRLAYEIENGSLELGLYVCHKCDNPGCVRPEHLFAGTPRDNVIDMIKKGRNRKPRGIDHYRSKLTHDQIILIRNSDSSNRKLAKEFKVSSHSIFCVKNKKTWKHID